jgi:hypothetical protein
VTPESFCAKPSRDLSITRSNRRQALCQVTLNVKGRMKDSDNVDFLVGLDEVRDSVASIKNDADFPILDRLMTISQTR